MLYKKLKHLTISDAIRIEESDQQFLALKELSENLENEKFYLSLVVANSLVCYQLSGKGEDYWTEFLLAATKANPSSISGLLAFFGKFLPNSKNNKRLVKIKLKRLEKLKVFLLEFIGKEEFFYKNPEILRDKLAAQMNQKKDAKTIVFAIKMFSYAARNVFDFLPLPHKIEIPIDSRLTRLYEKFNNGKFNSSALFYEDLAKKLKIPPLHLDAILWVNYEDLLGR